MLSLQVQKLTINSPQLRLDTASVFSLPILFFDEIQGSYTRTGTFERPECRTSSVFYNGHLKLSHQLTIRFQLGGGLLPVRRFAVGITPRKSSPK